MKQNPVVSALVLLVCLASFTLTAHGADYLSPLDVVAGDGGKVLYIAESTASKIAVFDVEAAKVVKTVSLGEPVGGLALSPDGKTLYATGAAVKGKVYAIDADSGKVSATIGVGHTPRAVAVSPDGKVLYVCNVFDGNVSVVDIASKKQVAKIPVKREPSAVAVTSDGKTLFVTNELPAGASDGDYAAAEISVIDTASNKVISAIQLPNGSTAVKDITISPDGKHAYATHILARYQLPTTQLERGWMNTNALTIIDVPAKKYVNTVLLDDVDLGAANPWSVACTADGKFICVTTAGTHELSVIDRAKLHDKLARAAAGEKVSDASSSADDVPNDLSFLVTLKNRIKLTGTTPRGLALVGTTAYITEYYSDSLGVVDFDPDVRPKPKSIALGPKTEISQVRQGEIHFHNATLCFQKWQSCSSCHPGNARVDALNWDLLNDGLGNPKNTKSLLLAHKTPPAMSMGVRSDAETAVRAGIRHIQFAVRPEEDAEAIDAYLKSLEPVPSPYLRNGKLSRSARRGKEIFESAGCGSCHSGPYYTDKKQYDFGMGKWLDEGKAFDTPTLIEAWRTAPYLHDGRAATILDVLKKFNLDDVHGNTSELNDRQLRALAEYVLSL